MSNGVTGGSTDSAHNRSYQRATDPQRYQVLHDVAHRLLDELEQQYAVTRSSNDHEDAHAPDVEGVLEVVRLTPEQSDQGPLTVTFTQFPGLDVRIGRWHRELYPWCGCHQCDDPSELLAAFNAMVRDLVEGDLVEELKRGLFNSRVSYRTPLRGGEMALDRHQAKALGPPARLAWAAWTPQRLRRSDPI